MICRNCGAVNEESVSCCANCGAVLENAANEKQVVKRASKEVGPTQPTKVLTLGIIGLALSRLGVPGIILSAIALKFANSFIAENGKIFGKAKVGRILAKVGLIHGIVMTVLWIIYVAIIYVAIIVAIIMIMGMIMVSKQIGPDFTIYF